MHLAHQLRREFSLDFEYFGIHDERADAFVGVTITLEMEMSEPALCTSLQDCQKLKTVRWTGTWRLAPRRAMSLLPRQDSQLLIVQGTAWITWEKPIGHWARSDGDHFLEAGQIMDVPAGARLVMEARHSPETLHFDWREMPPELALHRSTHTTLPELLRQWLQAWGQVGWSSGRLVRGLYRPRLNRLTAGDLSA
jgi:hypothetical protein